MWGVRFAGLFPEIKTKSFSAFQWNLISKSKKAVNALSSKISGAPLHYKLYVVLYCLNSKRYLVWL